MLASLLELTCKFEDFEDETVTLAELDLVVRGSRAVFR